MTGLPGGRRYRAFLSYSRKDEEWVRSLHRRLERFHVPRALRRNGVTRLRPIFRDKDELAGSPDLRRTLYDSVDNSEFLLLVTSPAAVRSEWVDEEVARFVGEQGLDRVLVVAVGEPDWEVDFPPALTPPGGRRHDFGWLDGRGTRRPDRRMVVRTAAGLLGVGFDHLWQRVRRRRRTMTAVVSAATVLLAGVASTVVLTLQHQVDTSEAAARSNRLSTIADRLRGGDPSLAAQFDVAARRADPTSELAYTNLLNDGNTPLNVVVTASSTAADRNDGALALSPDGRLLARTGLRQDQVGLWDLSAPGEPLRFGAAKASGGTAAPVSFAPDGRTLAVGGAAGVDLWDVATAARPVASASVPGGPVTALSFDPPGHRLATGGLDGTFSVWSLDEPAAPVRIGTSPPVPGPVVSLVFGVDGHTLSVGRGSGAVDIWDLTGPVAALKATPVPGASGTTGNVLALRPDGSAVSVTDTRGNNAFWRLDDVFKPGYPAPVPNTALSGSVAATAFGPDGNLLAAGNRDGTVTLWNTRSGARPTSLTPPLSLARQGEAAGVTGLTVGPDGRGVAVLDSVGTLVVWRLPARYRVQPDVESSEIDDIVVTSDGRNVAATRTRSTTANIWSLSGPLDPVRFALPSTETEGILGLALSSSGGLAAVTGAGVGVWSTADPRRPTALGPPAAIPGGSDGRPTSPAYSPDGRTLAVTSAGSTALWDLTDPARPAPRATPIPGGRAVFSPDSRLLATTGEETGIWDVSTPDTPARLATIPVDAIDLPVFDRDAGVLLVPVGKPEPGVEIWRVTDPSHPSRLGKAAVEGTDSTLPGLPTGLSPDGRTLAVGTSDGAVQLWDVGDPTDPRRMGRPLSSNVNKVDQFITTRQYVSGIVGVVFSADGHTLAAVNRDGTIRMWYLDDEQVIGDLCAATGNTLTAHQWQQHAPDIPYAAPCPGAPPAQPASAAPAGTPAPTTTPSGTPADRPASGDGPCQSGNLDFGYGTAPTEDTVRLVVTNKSGPTCTLDNLPDVGVTGTPDAEHEAQYRLRQVVAPPGPPLPLAAGQQAHVDVMFTGPASNTGVDPWVPRTITLTLPYGAGTLSLPWTSRKPLEPFVGSSHPPTFSRTFVAGP